MIFDAGKRATSKAADGTVEMSYAHLQGGKNTGRTKTPAVVQM
jgi:hypothetical protein